MKRYTRILSMTLVMAGLAIVQTPRSAQAHDDDKKNLIVTVAFGAGLGAGPPANHHVIPQTIHVRAGGTVNFVVAGLHEIFVYKPGTTPMDVLLNAPPLGEASFINYGLPIDPNNDILFYVGINPATLALPTGANLSRPPASAARSNLQNRVETVHFPEPGTYLVICNINLHFRDGMYAFVKVRGNDHDEKD